MKRFIIVLAVLVLAAPAWAGGPIILMGIDAEDGGPGGPGVGHGPIANYVSVVNSVLSNVTNGGSGILVIGGGKNPPPGDPPPGDQVTAFWNAIAAPVPTGTGKSVTYVNGAAGITNVSFGGFAMIAVVSDFRNTASGGLTEEEGAALNARAPAIASFVNGGGGLLGFSQCALPTPYGYLGGVGSVTCSVRDYDTITPTDGGTNVGISDALNVCCWHDTYTTFPSFLNVLATATSLGGSPLPPGLVAAIGGAEVAIPGFVTTTVAGTGERTGDPPAVPPGFNSDGILAINSQLSSPFAAAVDGDGNVYIADRNNHRIRRVDAGSGIISTFAGTGVPGFNGDVDGAGTPRLPTQAQLNSPTGVAIGDAGKIIIVDSGNHIIRVVNPNGTTITTVAGTPMTPGFRDGNQGDLVSNPATAPRFLFPRSVAFHALDNSLIVADPNNQRIRRVTSAGVVSTLKGDGVPDFADDAPTGARLNNPMGVAVNGVNVFVADEGNQRIRTFSVLADAIGPIATVAGSGVAGSAEGAALSAQFNSPSGVAVDVNGSVYSVYVADLANNVIRKIQTDLVTGVVSTFAGTGVPGFADGLNAQFEGPISVALGLGELLVVDLGNQRVRRIIFEESD